MKSRMTAALAIAAGLSCTPVWAQPAPNGETLFKQRCQSCHSVTAARPATLGPSLRGVVDRKAASTAFRYSEALKNSGLTWNRANLDRYLAAPSKMIPGTRMTVSLTDPRQRAAIIGFLEGVR